MDLIDWTLVRFTRRCVKAIAVLSVAVAFSVILGWCFDVSFLKRIAPGLITMKFNTALGLLMCGAALGIKSATPQGGKWTRLCDGLAALTILIAAATLIEFLFGFEFGIDQLVFRDLEKTRPDQYPGRMALTSAVAFLFMGIALLTVDRKSRVAQIFTVAPLVLSMLSLLGYIYGVAALYSVSFYGIKAFSSMALHTATLLFLLSLGVLHLRPECGICKLFMSSLTGGAVVRRVIPATIIVPLALGWIQLQGQRLGYFPPEFGISLCALASIIVIACIVFLHAWKLGDTESALIASERRFRTLADNAPVGIFQTDSAGQCFYVNPRWCEMTGLTAEQVQGAGWAKTLQLKDQTNFHEAWVAAAAKGDEWNQEVTFTRSNGQNRHASLSAAPLRDDAGKITGHIGTLTDISAMKEAEDTLLRQAEDLRRSNTDLEQFAYMASHDLQEPLRMVANYTELLSKRYRTQLSEEADQFIEYAVEGAKRMRSLIDDLLEYSKAGTDAEAYEDVHLDRLLSEVLADLGKITQEKKAHISYDTLPVVHGNGDQIRQVLENLLSNSLTFASRDPRIYISASRRGNWWTIGVRDNGIGIDPSYIDQVFQVFNRLHTKSEFPGNGVGLSLCKRIIEKHQGRIWVESKPGEGATFFFTLPAEGYVPAAAGQQPMKIGAA